MSVFETLGKALFSRQLKAQAATVSGAGAVYSINRLLGSSSTLALITGTSSNLTLSGSSIAAATALPTGVSQTAVVRETLGQLAAEYPVVLTGAVVPATAPAAPTLTVTPGNAQNTLAWTDGATGGAAITSHNLYAGASAGALTLVGAILSGSPYIDTGLTNGVARFYALTAVNAASLESPRATGSGTPAVSIPRITTLTGGRSAELAMPDAYWPAIYAQGQDPNMHPSLGTFTVTAIKSGNWSDPTTWNTGVVPVGGDLVNIASPYEVLYDVSTPITPYANPAALLTAYRSACDTLKTTPADSTALATIAGIEAKVIKAVHIGGTATFRISTSVSTFLLCDNLVSHGAYIAGEEGTPVTHLHVICGTSDPGATTKTGIMTMGRTRMVGAPKTVATKFSIDPTVGATQVTLDQVPFNMSIGDDIVITSTAFAGNAASDASYTGPTTAYVPEFGDFNTWRSNMVQRNATGFKLSYDEVRTVTDINGPVVSFAVPLAYAHPTIARTLKDGTPSRIEPRCVNLTRSLRYEGAYWREKGVAGTGRHRGHTMHMHVDDIVRKFAQFRNLGRTRTDPTLTSAQNTATDGCKASSGGAYLADPNNVIGRYPVHDHWTGPYFYRRPVISEGLSIHSDLAGDPTPGWSYTQHHSRSNLKNCVTFNTRGAGFACELGSEIGQWDGCLSIYNRGDGYTPAGYGDRYEVISNHNGHAGVAFDMQSRAVMLTNCIGISSRYDFIWHQQKTPPISARSPDSAALRLVEPISLGTTEVLSSYPLGIDQLGVYGHLEAQIPDGNGNEGHDVDVGFYVSSRDVHDGGDVMPMGWDNLKMLADKPFFIFNYSFNYNFSNFLFVGKGKGVSTAGLHFGTKSYTLNFRNGRVEGFNYVINDVGGFNYAGFVVDVDYDTTAFSNQNIQNITSGNTLASHPANGIMGPWALVTARTTDADVRVRDYVPLTSADMPQPYPIAPFSTTVEPSPGTPKPYMVLDAGTGGTVTPSGLSQVSVSGTLVDSWGIRYWPTSQRFQTAAADPAHPVRKNTIANGTELVRRNACYTPDGGTTWKTRLWFNDQDRGTHVRLLIPVDITLSGFDPAFLAKHQVADGNATKPAFPMLPEELTYDNTPAVQTKAYLWDFTGLVAAFTAQQDVAVSSTSTSNTLTVTRLTSGQTVPVTISGGNYSQNGGAYTNVATTAKTGDTFTLQNVNGATLGGATTATLTVGGIAYGFTSTVQNYPATGTMARDYFDDQVTAQNLDARAGWELLGGSAGGAIVDSTKMLTAAALAAQTSTYRYTTDLGALQQYVEFNAATTGFNSYRHLVSMSDANNWIGFAQNNNTIRVYKCVAGVETQMFSFTVPNGSGAQLLFRAEYNATTGAVAVYCNNDQIGSGTVAAPPPVATRSGLRVTTNGTATAIAAFVGFGAGPKNSFGDTFTRANENLEASPNWTRVDGTAAALTVFSNQAKGTVTGSPTSYRVPNRGVNRTAITAFIQSFTTGRICVQLTDSNNYVGIYLSNGSTIALVSVKAGAVTAVANITGMSSSTGFVYTLEYDPTTGVANVYQNWNLVGSYTVASGNRPPVTTHAGLLTNGNGVLADNVIVEAF
ncbi:hypothetical protein U1872_06245 [Sphingomonas sp. RB3P16]|uniref:hypothetical protein n=1 Tax=Parasphingomonas frigoris TaxID=3096163 RepID=UPI002FCC09BC